MSSTMPPVRPRQSLSARLWLLTTFAVLLSEIVVFLPDIAHERHLWLRGLVEDASLSASAARDSQIDEVTRNELLRLSGTEAINLIDRRGKTPVLTSNGAAPSETFDLQQEDWFAALRHALRTLVSTTDHLVQVTADSPFRADTRVETIFHAQALNSAMRDFAGNFAVLSLLIAMVTGGLVYLAVLVLLVRPMRRITGSIAAFRADPERTVPLNPREVSPLPDDEITLAGRELAAMQHELRAALWRNARLAALGTMMAKVAHDLRGILTPALLTAERLQLNTDPKVSKAGDMLVQTVDRASELVRRALDYTREGPPPLQLAPVGVARLMDEAAETARPLAGAFRLENRIAATLFGRADRTELFRVLVNLLRNAAEAGAATVRVTAEHSGALLTIEVRDDGPGLPEAVCAHLFRPFVGSVRHGGSGLGLAIARDLMVAHGGDIVLVQTGPTGTIFRLTLPATEGTTDTERDAGTEAGNPRIAPAARADV